MAASFLLLPTTLLLALVFETGLIATQLSDALFNCRQGGFTLFALCL